MLDCTRHPRHQDAVYVAPVTEPCRFSHALGPLTIVLQGFLFGYSAPFLTLLLTFFGVESKTGDVLHELRGQS